jgi:sialidase-1
VAALWSKGNRSIAGSLPGISPDTTGQLVLVNSSDDGKTWSAPVSITPQVKRPAWHLFFDGPGNGIAMKNGNLVFAAQYWDENKIPHATIIYSEDHGITWKGQLAGPKSNTTESQVVETIPGTLLLNMRDNRGGYRSVASTSNLGNSWIEHRSSYNALPDPVCMGSIIKSILPINGVRKEILLFSNPNTQSGRFNMTIQASSDYGVTWPLQNRLLIDERIGFGYSSLTQIDEQTIGILYEGVRDLYFVKVAIKDIIKSK